MGRQRVLIGLPKSRCGSTFLKDVMTAHPQIWIGREIRLYCRLPWTEHFRRAKERLERFPVRGGRGLAAIEKAYEVVAKRHPDISRRVSTPKLSAECIRELEQRLMPDGKLEVIGDKGYVSIPSSKFMVNSLIEALSLPLPMKVIYIYRDPRDVFTSIARFRKEVWQPIWAHDPWRHSIEFVEAWGHWEKIKASGSVPYLEIKYEHLMAHPKDVLRGVAQFLGLRSAGPMFKYLKKHRKHSVSRWRKHQPRIEKRMHPSIFPLMEKLGYRKGK